MSTIIITRPIPDAGVKLLKQQKGFTIKQNAEDRTLGPDELKTFIKGADAILSLLTDKIDGTVMDAAGKQLKIIANNAIGFDNIDLPAAQKRGIVVTNTPSELSCEAVAEHTLALAMALAHRLGEADRFTRAGKYKVWEPLLLIGTLLYGKTFGIIGSGRIGAAAARKAHGIGMNIVYSDTKKNETLEKELSAKYVSMEKLLGIADVVSLHVPLLPSTRYLIDTAELAMMKKGAFLINTARGPVVREKALLRALRTGRIAGAGLDVYECEPLIDCDITDHLELRVMPNVVLTPHIASASMEARQQMSEMAAQNIIAVLSGKSPINPAK